MLCLCYIIWVLFRVLLWVLLVAPPCSLVFFSLLQEKSSSQQQQLYQEDISKKCIRKRPHETVTVTFPDLKISLYSSLLGPYRALIPLPGAFNPCGESKSTSGLLQARYRFVGSFSTANKLHITFIAGKKTAYNSV